MFLSTHLPFPRRMVRGFASLGQLRCEIFNIFNVTNWANPGSSLSNSSTLGLRTATRNGGGAPGIGFGEPRNIQLAAKVPF